MLYAHSFRSPTIEFMLFNNLDAAKGELAVHTKGFVIYKLETFERALGIPIELLTTLESDFQDLKDHILLGWKAPGQREAMGAAFMLLTEQDAEDAALYRDLKRTIDFVNSPDRSSTLPPPITARGFDHAVTTLLVIDPDPTLRTANLPAYMEIVREFEVQAREALVAYRAELSARDIAQELASDERTPDDFAFGPSL